MLHPFNKIEKTAEEIYKFDLLKAESAGAIGVGNKPYLRRHSDKGVLLIHGFAAAPDELLPLAYELEKYDISVYVVRVAGHGCSLGNFYKTTYLDWYDSISTGYNALASFCSKICIVGQSNGGLLATAAAKFNKCDCLALLAPAYKVNIPGFFLIKYIRKIIKNVPRHLKEIEYNYPVFTTEQTYQLKLLQDEVANYIKDINVPVLLAVSEKDVLISTKEAVKTVNKMASKDKTIYKYNNKQYNVKHILTEKHSVKIISDISEWVKEKLV